MLYYSTGNYCVICCERVYRRCDIYTWVMAYVANICFRHYLSRSRIRTLDTSKDWYRLSKENTRGISSGCKSNFYRSLRVKTPVVSEDVDIKLYSMFSE